MEQARSRMTYIFPPLAPPHRGMVPPLPDPLHPMYPPGYRYVAVLSISLRLYPLLQHIIINNNNNNTTAFI